ncbi:MFS_1_like domain-containing protein [Caerostris extrusa]|uniref:MFS_1_like domain-containing protein n=1 Tax=Caerostris extrusa TaxID=172846 RepID=A0AAV4WIY6_CAEEX|nr:MFS_1_like domain-containing protein [Caerostris extrusa]
MVYLKLLVVQRCRENSANEIITNAVQSGGMILGRFIMITPERQIFLSLNVVNFLFYAGIAGVAPFFSVHMRALGLTVWHAIWVHAASGMVCIVAPLLLGTLAESRLYKLCFSISLAACLAAYLALAHVPPVRRAHRQPRLDFDCSSPLSAALHLEKCSNFDTCAQVAEAWSSDALFRLSHCRFEYKDGLAPSDPLQMCFRTTGNTTHHCLVYDPHVRENPVLEFNSDLTTWQFTEYRNVSPREFSEADSDSPPLTVCSFSPATSGTAIRLGGRSHDALTCQRSLTNRVEGIKCVLSLRRARGGGRAPCFDVLGDLSRTFWLYLGLRTVADALFVSALCLLEGVTLRVIQSGPQNRGAYGRSKVCPAAALAIFPLASGALLDNFALESGSPHYLLPFVLFAVCEAFAALLVHPAPLPVGGNTFRYELETSPRRASSASLERCVAAAAAVLQGAAWSVSQVFDPLLYQDLRFGHLTLGACQSVVFLCAIPFLGVSKILIQNIGEASLVSAAFAFHALHLAGLSFTGEWGSPWWALPFEAMKAFTLPIAWVALTAGVERGSSSKGNRIAMHYVLAIAHFGIGRILGCSAAGFVSEKYSMSVSYRAASVFCLVMSVLYLCFYHCFMKPRHRKIVAARCALQRQSINGSCLLLFESVPVNGRIVPANQN